MFNIDTSDVGMDMENDTGAMKFQVDYTLTVPVILQKLVNYLEDWNLELRTSNLKLRRIDIRLKVYNDQIIVSAGEATIQITNPANGRIYIIIW